MKNTIIAIALSIVSFQAQAKDCTFAERYNELETIKQKLVQMNAEMIDLNRNGCSKDVTYSFAEADAILAQENDIESELEKLSRSLTK